MKEGTRCSPERADDDADNHNQEEKEESLRDMRISLKSIENEAQSKCEGWYYQLRLSKIDKEHTFSLTSYGV